MEDTAQDLLAEIVAGLGQVAGVAAIVLGGSRARGTHTPDSDFDLGIYYDPAAPLDIAALDVLAARLDDRHKGGLVTPLGGWGPWINGGGWLTIGGRHVDFLYRDIARVRHVVEEASAGRFEMAYQPGHPHGFPSFIYMGEIAVCRALWDPQGAIAGLKAGTETYPPALRQAVIDRFYWEAGFSLANAAKAASRADVAYIAGCCFRAVACLTQCLFAANRVYWLNEKGSVAQATTFSRAPKRYSQRVQAAFEALRPDAASLQHAIAVLEKLVGESEWLR
jgi:predicted nucleotidyltransferase